MIKNIVKKLILLQQQMSGVSQNLPPENQKYNVVKD